MQGGMSSSLSLSCPLTAGEKRTNTSEEKGREKGKAVFTHSKFSHPTLGICLSPFTSERTSALKFRFSKSYLSPVYEVGGVNASAPIPWWLKESR